MSPSALHMFRYSPEELVGQSIKSLIAESDQELNAISTQLRQAGETDAIVWDRELQGLAKNGHTFPIELTIGEATLPLEGPFIGLVRDISERRRSEAAAREVRTALLAEQAALKEVNARWSLAAESAGIAIFDWDLTTNRVETDASLRRLFGVDIRPCEVVDIDFWVGRVFAEDRPAVRQELQDALDNIRPYDTEFRIQWQDGSVHHVKAAGIVERSERGKAVRMVGAAFDITARKEAETLLQQSHEKEQLLLLGVKDYAVFRLDREGTILTWNEGAEHIKGYSAAEIIGCHFSKFYEAADIAQGKPALVLAIATKEGRYEEEGWRLRKDGSRFWANVCISALYDATGELRGFGKVTRDITERKRAEEARDQQELALRKSEESLNRTGRMAGVGGWEIDLVSRSVHWTDETARLHGLEPGYQPTLKESLDFFDSEARLGIMAAIERATIDGQPWELKTQLVRADGRRICVILQGSVEFADGHAVRMNGAIQDVTTHVLAEEELRYQANLLDLSHETIMVRDLNGCISFWNRGAQEMYGYNKEQAVGQISHTLLQTIFPSPLADVNAELMAKGRWDGELQHTTQSGKQIVVASRWALQRHHKNRAFDVLEINDDISERKRAEEMLRKATVEAEEANRAKSEFLANMSHEIRTPMNAIMGMTHLALRTNPTPAQCIYLKKIGSAADSLLTIVNDILDFSKIEAGKMELEHIPFSVEKVLQDLSDIVSDTAKRKNIAVSFSASKEVPALLIGDPLRLGQILINLVNNGIKFTPEGGVRVTVSATSLTENTTEVSFRVVDTGIGMSKEQLAKIFRSFNQADPSVTRKFGGTGLGLAISKQLCELMGGTISASSEEGKGSVFLLKARFGVATTCQNVPPSERPLAGGRKCVLIVDGSAAARNVLVAMLTANGFDSRAVCSGEEAMTALQIASSTGQPLDLVLMNWRMPGMNGSEIARKLKDQLDVLHVPSIIMVSESEREHLMRGVTGPELKGVLVKPVKKPLLNAQMEAIDDRVLVRTRRHPAAQLSNLVGRRVLLVEDNEINRYLATELMADLGILVSVAVNGREGVNRIEAEPFDLVLMDIQMPVMDGITATRFIRSDRRFQLLPIIAMTAHAMNGDREKSLAAGMNDHLTKPISPDRLSSALLYWMPEVPQSAVISPAPERMQ